MQSRMYTSIITAVLIFNTVNCDRYTSVFGRNDPFANFPGIRSRRYRVFEGEEDIKQDSAGHKLRFALDPQLKPLRPFRSNLFQDERNLRDSRQQGSSLIHPREDLGRYGFRPPINEDIRPAFNQESRSPRNQERLLFRRPLPEEHFIESHPPLYYADQIAPIRRAPIYYYNDPYFNRQISPENLHERNRQAHENQVQLVQPPPHPVYIQNSPNKMVYSPAYAHGKDVSNPVPASSHLPLYITGGGGNWHKNNDYGYSPHYRNSGGEELKKSAIDKEKKEKSDSDYHEEKGKKEEEIIKDEKSFKKGEEAVKSEVSDSGHFVNEEEKKTKVEDQEKYNGGKSYKQEEENEDEKKNKASHKKGHVIRSFKNSHHKEETGNNEEYYDEAHDADDSFKFDKSNGQFGEKKEEQYKGDQEKKKYESHEKLDKGKHESSEASEKIKEDKDENKENKFETNSKQYGNHNSLDEESLLGHQESKSLHEQTPFHVPIHRNV